MPITIPADLNGQQSAALDRLLHGDDTFFSARIKVDGRYVMMRLTAEPREDTVVSEGYIRKPGFSTVANREE